MRDVITFMGIKAKRQPDRQWWLSSTDNYPWLTMGNNNEKWFGWIRFRNSLRLEVNDATSYRSMRAALRRKVRMLHEDMSNLTVTPPHPKGE